VNILEVTGLVLAGGMGRRMGGVDKGLVLLEERPMVAHVIERLTRQVGAIVINANQNLERYEALGYPVVRDTIGGFAGPLAGLHAGLSAAGTPFVVTSPCDSPFLPQDLVARLANGLESASAQIAVAHTFAQPHPVFALVSREVVTHLASFLEGGGRKIDAWYATLRVAAVQFDDCEDAFRNINTPDELAAAARHA
jgi:molybdopterin-guanine dinucleotide biosynthesis protein A